MGNIHTIGNGQIQLAVDLSEGMNVNSISLSGKDMIICDEKRKAGGGTYAVPVLFPTPNRTENLHYRYGKRDIKAVMHGFLRHEEFTLDEKRENLIRGHFDFNGENELFPYRGRMTIQLNVFPDSVFWIFNFENLSDENIAYNLALHPFFTKEGLRSIEVGVSEEMLNKETLIPTGETMKRDRIALRTEDVSMDTVFLMEDPFDAVMHYEEFDVHFKASEDFRHAVVFSSPEKEFICIEPQTGSTDAHNLHGRGFEREASLIETRPGENHMSWFSLEFNRYKSKESR